MIILPLGGDGDALVGAPCIQLLFSRLSARHMRKKDELGMGRGRLVPACCSAQLRLPAEYEYRQRGNAEEAHTQAAWRDFFGRCARRVSQHGIGLYGSVHYHDNSLEQSIISYDYRYHVIIDNYHISSMFETRYGYFKVVRCLSIAFTFLFFIVPYT